MTCLLLITEDFLKIINKCINLLHTEVFLNSPEKQP